MRVAVIGTGYVGITTSISLCELDHQVIGVDTDQTKITQLRQGKLPIYEPGLDQLLQLHLDRGTIKFTNEISKAVQQSDIIIIAVGTPPLSNGEPNMGYVEAVAKSIGQHMDSFKIIVNKSTVPVGTVEWVEEIIKSELEKRDVVLEFAVISNPEFLQEGNALENARHPDRIVIGCSSGFARQQMEILYEKVESPILFTSPKNAEMIKYASNAFLATKISFINEVARLCDCLNVDVTEVAKGMGYDKRIGPHFLQAGIGYGGSCFPKDVAALHSMGQKCQIEMSLLQKVQEINQTQAEWFVGQMEERLGGLCFKRIALLGLAFKPNTDDIREAPSTKLIPLLAERGAQITAYDPIVKEKMKELFPDIHFASDSYEAAQNADSIVLSTEWKEFRELDWLKIKNSMRGSYIFDGRNTFQPKDMARLGFYYVGVGRSGDSLPKA